MLQERVDLAAARLIFDSLGRALQHLHAKGRIHGDFKQMNVVRTREEDFKWKLIDLVGLP